MALSVGCPGLKRPPPSAQRAQTESTPSPEPTTARESPRPTASAPALPPLDALRAEVEQVRSGYGAFVDAPARPAWEALMSQLQAAEDQGFALLETHDDPAAVEDLLYELGDLRAELSEREP